MLGLSFGEEDAEEARNRAALRDRRPTDAGLMARTTSQLVSTRRPPTRAGPSLLRARLPPGPGKAGRPGILRAGRCLTWGQEARPRTAGALGTSLSLQRAGSGTAGAGPAGALTGARRWGRRGGVTGLSRWKCLESLLLALRGAAWSLRGYLWFCLQGLHL